MTNSFETWVEQIFGEGQQGNDWWVGHSYLTVVYLTRLFSHAPQVLEPYSNEQVSRGLTYLASDEHSQTMLALLDEHVLWYERQTCIQSIYKLYEEFFASRCALNSADSLQHVSLKFFEMPPIRGCSESPAVNAEFLDLFRKVLSIDSDICKQGALVGLGVWRPYYSEEVDAILDGFLVNNPDLGESLREYVSLARKGVSA